MTGLTLGFFPLIVGFLTLVSAVIVIASRNPIVSAVSLMMTLLLTGVLYFGMDAYFIGAVQILIYAGAIAVLFVFIQMLLDLTPLRVQIPGRKVVQILGILSGLVLFVAAAANVIPGFFEMAGTSAQNTQELHESQAPVSIALTFLSKYMIPFQITGVLIMAAIMGAVVLGKPVRSKN